MKNPQNFWHADSVGHKEAEPCWFYCRTRWDRGAINGVCQVDWNRKKEEIWVANTDSSNTIKSSLKRHLHNSRQNNIEWDKRLASPLTVPGGC